MDEDFANPLRASPCEEMGARFGSMKVKDPPELPIAWLAGGAQASMLGLALGEGSSWDALR